MKLLVVYFAVQGTNEVYEFLSGVPITPSTRFLSLRLPEVLHNYKKTVHFMRYVLVAQREFESTKCAINAHNPKHSSGSKKGCHCCSSAKSSSISGLDSANMECHGCPYCIPHAIFRKQLTDRRQMSFSIFVDHTFKAVVLTVSAQLAIEEMFDSVSVDVDILPFEPPREDWLVHKEILQIALDIRQTLRDELSLSKAFNTDPVSSCCFHQLLHSL
jgi:sn1-specific diacylglycerol lipase